MSSFKGKTKNNDDRKNVIITAATLLWGKCQWRHQFSSGPITLFCFDNCMSRCWHTGEFQSAFRTCWIITFTVSNSTNTKAHIDTNLNTHGCTYSIYIDATVKRLVTMNEYLLIVPVRGDPKKKVLRPTWGSQPSFCETMTYIIWRSLSIVFANIWS